MSTYSFDYFGYENIFLNDIPAQIWDLVVTAQWEKRISEAFISANCIIINMYFDNVLITGAAIFNVYLFVCLFF